MTRLADVVEATAIRPFQLNVPETELAELRRRINATRWPEKETVSDFSQGVQLAFMQTLARYWATDYDWRKVEARLNSYPQFITEIDGLDIHFLHIRSKHDDAMPLVVSHGWPGSPIEQLKIIDPLTNPTAYGASASDAFHVVIPSMAGYGCSGKPTTPGWDPKRMAGAWVELMKRLGYSRFSAQGGDWGGFVTNMMAEETPPELIGIHVNFSGAAPPDVARALQSGGPAPDSLSAEERRAYDQMAFLYQHVPTQIMMAAHPQTLYGLADSPIALAAWMIDHDVTSYLIQASLAHAREVSKVAGWSVFPFTASPRGPGAITVAPNTIGELHAFLASAGDDLVGVLRRRLLEGPRDDVALSANLLFVVRIPKQRTEGGDIERVETWAFLAPSIRESGVALGIWEAATGGLALMVPPREERRGEGAQLTALSVIYRLSRSGAAVLNGRADSLDRRIVGIGAGALGSQVLLNAARAGIGLWTLVDRDRLLPHNLARHALDGFATGHHKVDALAAVANSLMDGLPAFESIVADVLNPGSERARLEERLGTADLIVDMAASIPVSRHLAHDASGTAKRVAFFLNPVGSDLIMLAEDSGRETRLDALEMQYYRGVLRDSRLQGHLRPPAGRLRYGTSCRDVSARLPQALVALHAAIAARRLRDLADLNQPAIRIWQAFDETDDVTKLDIAPRKVTHQRVGDWTVVYDEGLLDTIFDLRRNRLPNETGGVLLGAFDVERRMVYVADTIPSPLDSKERKTLYIRGTEGLRERLEDAQTRTFGQLEYVGEWHSHPNGYGCMPSGDDLTVLSWLSSHLDADGVPGVMMIACEGGALSVLLAEVVTRR